MVLSCGRGEHSTDWEQPSRRPHSTELSPGGFEQVGVAGAGGPQGGMGGEEFLEVGRGSSMDTLVGEDGDLEFYQF